MSSGHSNEFHVSPLLLVCVVPVTPASAPDISRYIRMPPHGERVATTYSALTYTPTHVKVAWAQSISHCWAGLYGQK